MFFKFSEDVKKVSIFYDRLRKKVSICLDFRYDYCSFVRILQKKETLPQN